MYARVYMCACLHAVVYKVLLVVSFERDIFCLSLFHVFSCEKTGVQRLTFSFQILCVDVPLVKCLKHEALVKK